MKITYQEKRFSNTSLAIIHHADRIIRDYAAQGYNLTLRQLYYQFVARDLIANTQREYKRIGDVINNARLAGLIDWDAIVDRTRNVRQNPHWHSPKEIVSACARQYAMDKWDNQKYRPEVWIEKDALIGVIEGVCRELDVSYFSCRGYVSQSEMWGAAQRLITIAETGQQPVLIHLGDHDPSGIDMTRDISERLCLFFRSGDPFPVNRIALNMDQVRRYKPPPNPAKITDSRYKTYIKEHGRKSWELDALEPQVLSDLVRSEILFFRDDDRWDDIVAMEATSREQIQRIAEGM